MQLIELIQEMNKNTETYDKFYTDTDFFNNLIKDIETLRQINTLYHNISNYLLKQDDAFFIIYVLLHLIYQKNIPLNEKSGITIVYGKPDKRVCEYEEHSFAQFTSNEIITKQFKNVENLLVKIIRGLFVDPKRNIIYFDKFEIGMAKKSVKSMANVITLLTPDITSKIDNNILDNLDFITNDCYHDNKLYDKINTILQTKFRLLSVFGLENKINQQFLTISNNKIMDTKRLLEETAKTYETQYEMLLELQDKRNRIKNNTETEKSKLTETLLRFIEKGLIHHINIITDSKYNIYWNSLPIVFYEKENLEKSYKNITTDTKRRKLIEKVINDEASFYTPPFVTKLSINSKISFKTRRHEKHIISENNYNKHPLWNGGEGCRGGFKLVMSKTEQDLDFNKLLHLIVQFYQSITVNDPLGEQAVEYSIIADNDGNILTNDITKAKTIEELDKLHY